MKHSGRTVKRLKGWLAPALAAMMALSMLCGVAATYKAGSYTGSAKGFGGTVSVKLTVDSKGKITGATVTAKDETPEIGGKAAQQLAQAIVKKGSLSVDAVSGATNTSRAVLSAAKKALAKASDVQENKKTVKDGRYVTRTMGMMGWVNLATTFEDGKIKEVRFLSSNETRHMSDKAIQTLPALIVQNQTLNVDTVTGATVTSNAILNGVREAIGLAGGDPEDFSKPAPKPQKVSKTVEEEVDVVIAGAGLAGMTAAYNLTKEGKKVLVLEKLSYYGGSFLVSGGLMMSADTILHKAYGTERLSGWMSSQEAMIETYKKTIDPASPYANPDIPFISVMIKSGSEMVDKLILEGVGFAPFLKYGNNPYIGSGPWSNYKQNAGSVAAIDMMYDRITYGGNRIITETTVTELTMEGGRVTGVVARGDDGTTYRVKADAVLLATGGWMQNEELVKEYCPEYSGYYVNALVSNTGDGLFLAKDAGADWVCMDMGITATNKAFHSKSNTIFFYRDIPIILVNAHGERFVNEVSSYKKYLRQCKEERHGGKFYYIFDEVGFALAHDSDNFDLDYQYLIDKGDIVEYESLDALAKDLGLTKLKDTVAQVNRIAKGEETDEFGNTVLPYLETRGKMYAMRIEPGAYITHGGVKIDPDTHVLTAEDQVIPGLYAAGLVTGSMEVRDGGDYGNGNCQALAFGLKAAQTIAKDITK